MTKYSKLTRHQYLMLISAYESSTHSLDLYVVSKEARQNAEVLEENKLIIRKKPSDKKGSLRYTITGVGKKIAKELFEQITKKEWKIRI